MTSAALCLGFLLLVVAAIGAVGLRLLSGQRAVLVMAGLVAWLVYVGALARLGILRDPTLRPPGMVFVIVPIVLFIGLVFVRSSVGLRIALAVPLPLLLGAQGFRIGVELLLARLWSDGLVPRMLTIEGANFDILVGLSAPIIAWLAARGTVGSRVILAWNVMGLTTLANVVVRSALTAPGPLHVLHGDVPNVAIASFPFVYIAGFFAPLAVALHVLAIRALRAHAQVPASAADKPRFAAPVFSTSERSADRGRP